MNKFAMKQSLAMVGLMLAGTPGLAQVPAPAPKVATVTISQGPALELARGDQAIIRWTTNNPGGTDSHYGIVKYGTSADHLDQTAVSPIHLNRAHADTVFRVSVGALTPQTVYYYKVSSMGSDGSSDGAESTVSPFTMPAGP